MQVNNKKKLLGKLYACKFWVRSKKSYSGIFISNLSCDLWNDKVLIKFFVFLEAYSFPFFY